MRIRNQPRPHPQRGDDAPGKVVNAPVAQLPFRSRISTFFNRRCGKIRKRRFIGAKAFRIHFVELFPVTSGFELNWRRSVYAASSLPGRLKIKATS
jgi:hypothetical protein